ncbi:MAG: YebC/PmpR family DNA-binding transcriptional regulator [Candidatus Peregrinibacteria bacterium]|nr:YebC/PmpR family DNA-binding transcriptional regulator [Candidatus Peregrinibacteria bacterium]MCB9808034.1 YebC/PmpR family DNA-binding transcriptional regulator [Candidatus Peribacteria bacterium]
MSGHSKWSTIKHKKGAADAKRGKIFTKHAKLIEIAAREGGGGDLTMNAALKAAVDNAKADNVPNANIDRAMKKGTGELKGEATVSVTYEAYAPGGAALIIECLTDNKNRTLPNIRTIVEKRGGKMAESGSVMFMFSPKGVVIAQGTMNDDLELALIDAGAEDIHPDGDLFTVTTNVTGWTKVRDVLKEQGYDVQEAGMKLIAQQEVPITEAETAEKLMEMIEAIEEDDDVSDVHTNADISDEVAALL